MSERVGDILARTRSIAANVLQQAEESARADGCRIGQALVSRGVCDEDAVAQALAQQFAMPLELRLDGRVDEELLHELPIELFRDGRCMPLGTEDDVLEVAVGDPLDIEIVLSAEALGGMVCRTVLTTPGELMRWRERFFGEGSLFAETAGRIAREFGGNGATDHELTLQEIRERTESEPIVKLATLIFDEAIRLGASDVHIEPTERNANVRFRIDGMLRQHMELTRGVYVPLTSRIKILADMDISEKRVPQDGRIRHERGSAQFDFRVSTLPTHHGEKTVIRILKHDKSLLEVENLGMPARMVSEIGQLIEKPQGMVIVTGPTGSGKSSTLFACLNRIRRKPINITTLENPIEYKLPGINQVQINEKAGVTFAGVLRSVLRQDPDVILIGEIRDGETAQIAMQAAQTGHLVLSTLHTNDAVAAVTRLRDLGVPGYLVASSLLGLIAQRLVRVLCPDCKVESTASVDLKARWRAALGDTPMPKVFTAPGCRRCGGQGYAGRTGLFELVPLNDALREMIINGVSEVKIRQYLRTARIQSLIDDGIEQASKGITTPDELLRVVLVEDTMDSPGGTGLSSAVIEASGGNA
jgi:type IV pilus assembly protein PilB